jgi:hypothetical protein
METKNFATKAPRHKGSPRGFIIKKIPGVSPHSQWKEEDETKVQKWLDIIGVLGFQEPALLPDHTFGKNLAASSSCLI